jgi:hypothetical protein
MPVFHRGNEFCEKNSKDDIANHQLKKIYEICWEKSAKIRTNPHSTEGYHYSATARNSLDDDLHRGCRHW